MQPISLTQLLEAGCHFGHKADRWHPKADIFIYQKRDGIHVIDLAKTKAGLEAAAEFVKNMVADGKTIVFIGTKRQAATIIREEATRVGAPFMIQRWVGGLLTNWPEINKNLEKVRRLTEEQETGAWNKFPKHERVKLAHHLAKLNHLYEGVVQLMSPPDALFVVDVKKEQVSILEARKMGVPVIGVVDTNSDPDMADYVIPSNDDAVGAISLIVKYMADAYEEGRQAFTKESEKAAKEAEKEKTKAAEKVEPQRKPETTPAEGVQSKKEVTKEIKKQVETAEKSTAKPEVKATPTAAKPKVEEKPESEAEKPKRGRKKKIEN